MPRPGTKRRISYGRLSGAILILLLLGAVANVAVAWACTQWVRNGTVTLTGLGGVAVTKGRATSLIVGEGGRSSASLSGRGVRVDRVFERDRDHPGGTGGTCIRTTCTAGYPAFSLRIRTSETLATSTVPLPLLDVRPLPPVPVLLGFLLNTVLYAAVIAATCVPFFLVRRVRCARRCARGLCTRCGYNLAGLMQCPECGLAAGIEPEPDAERAPVTKRT
jgi:hypothetical protein